jgi:hypothetical protein
LGYEGDVFADSNVGRVDLVVVEANVRLDLDATAGLSTPGENVEQRRLT